MREWGSACLLVAFAASGYAAFAALAAPWTASDTLRRGARLAGAAGVAALTLALVVLAHALYVRDFRFLYVGQYASRQLPWYFALSALWVGQAGSLLLWAWMLGMLTLKFGLRPRHRDGTGASGDGLVQESAYGLLMAYLCFLAATMVFAADPFERAAAPGPDGVGLSPLLQHPAMLIHPPVVFLGYAGWAVPAALMLAALAHGRVDHALRGRVRAWSLFSWAVLGMGIVLGAQWSYEELGWGGYWAWDPVENASLVPWLTGTALLHTLTAWRARGVLKRGAAGLAIATFALCNLATFLTRSGIFSSLHAFSRSPIGWLFLAMMAALAAGGLALVLRRDHLLAPERPLASTLSAEAMVAVSALALIMLALLVTAGTLFVAISEPLLGRRVLVGPAFYNGALFGSGLVLLGAIAPVPLLQWGQAPSGERVRALGLSGLAAALGACAALACGARHPLTVALVGIATGAVAAILYRIALDACRQPPATPVARFVATLRDGRRPYAGFVAHLGFCCLAVGVAGSALGTRRAEVDLAVGEGVRLDGRVVRFVRLDRIDAGDRLLAVAHLEIREPDSRTTVLRPAQHYHRLPRMWTTEAAIARRWSGDLYAVVHHGEGTRARFSLRVNPLMRLVWLGGWTMGLGAAIALVPLPIVRPRPSARRAERASSTLTAERERARSRRPSPLAHDAPRR
jgi:cytochrome c-type biogenesis protein CcmF